MFPQFLEPANLLGNLICDVAGLPNQGGHGNGPASLYKSRTQRNPIFVVALSGVFEVRAATRYRLQ